ncbi:MAG: hypothetical protein ACKOSS_02605 [Planctomycetia bacterium]
MSDPTALPQQPGATGAPTATGSSTASGTAGGAGRRGLLLLLFLASGGVGLAYEVAWTRLLARVVGSTPAGHTLVLGLFVAALGLGARWAGQRAARLRPRPVSVATLPWTSAPRGARL